MKGDRQGREPTNSADWTAGASHPREVREVRQLVGVETWLVTVGRVLAAFGLGVLAATRYPAVAGRLGLPLAIAGVACLLVAAVGLRRRTEVRDEPSPPAV